MGMVLTAFMMVGELAGAGIISVPHAIAHTKFWPGLLLMLITGVTTTITAVMLGECWTMLLQRHDEYRRGCRQPYAEIALRAFGPKMHLITCIANNITQFGGTVVLLLLTAKNLNDSLHSLFNLHQVHLCYLIVVLTIMLLPFSFLRSPENFWWAILFGMACTLCAIVFIIIGASIDFSTCHSHVVPPLWQTNKFLGAFGTMIFTYGGHPVYPTLQVDMRRPVDFRWSAIIGQSFTSLLYFPVAIFAYLTYGGSVGDSIINSIQTQWIQQVINLLVMSHCFVGLFLLLKLFISNIKQNTITM
ncbi:Aa-trans domain-containing protein [Aphelenchoides bicaudatus]|nr:Aa-trans domain-containing protein [Aphelenchoides bicaudatus]